MSSLNLQSCAWAGSLCSTSEVDVQCCSADFSTIVAPPPWKTSYVVVFPLGEKLLYSRLSPIVEFLYHILGSDFIKRFMESQFVLKLKLMFCTF